MQIIETSMFTKLIYSYLNDDEYIGLQGYLLKYPESGKIVPGSGGVRKLRWKSYSKGKRGGLRLIYYFRKSVDEIWMITIYDKNEIEDIPAHILKKISKEVKNAQS